ncbi:rft-1 [Pristionchus pacificus]|uniref:Riboflavin transporter n=1 Tax=Pristionchus pacificus TaxID=54126 RepID=A0A2A6CGI4_PRIPA|nr:rft-1 [Pristionchus pacificus]|eukprot:PDM77198.1 rft-1 [Pristionchus pacificus]
MSNLKVACFTLVVLFGSSSWMGTNSVWMQLPLLTSSLPEGWSLPSYLAMVVQIACIGPLVYGLLHKCCCSLSSAALILAALLMAVSCQSGLAVFWSYTAGGYSVLLYAFMFGLALVNATSNVLFMPFMSQYHPSLLHAYFVGMGLSSLVPSLLSLGQGTSNFECVANNGTMQPVFQPPRFSVSVYLWLIAAWTALATAAFVVLQYREWSDEQQGEKHECDSCTEEATPLKDGRGNEVRTTSVEDPSSHCPSSSPPSYHASPFMLLLLTAVVNAQMNGVIPSVHSFAALPYSQSVYHLGLTLSNIVSPIASFLPMFVGVRSLAILSGLTALSTVTTAFIVYLGLLSPGYLAESQTAGGVFSVLSVVVAAGLHSFLRTTFASSLRESGGGRSEHWLFWCGVFIQIGSFLGSAVMFPLINYTSLFQSAPMCQ